MADQSDYNRVLYDKLMRSLDMNKRHEKVMVQLDMTIDDDGVVQTTSGQYQGHLHQHDSFDVLIYNESLEDGSEIRNFLTIYPDRVTIKRSGAMTMTQQFVVNHQTKSVYRHPYGSMLMETFTTSITYDPQDQLNQGKLTILYRVKLNGTEERKHQLVILYSKEDI